MKIKSIRDFSTLPRLPADELCHLRAVAYYEQLSTEDKARADKYCTPLTPLKDERHPTHRTRYSDASTFDQVCVLCGARSITGGGWGDLKFPCSGTAERRQGIR